MEYKTIEIYQKKSGQFERFIVPTYLELKLKINFDSFFQGKPYSIMNSAGQIISEGIVPTGLVVILSLPDDVMGQEIIIESMGFSQRNRIVQYGINIYHMKMETDLNKLSWQDISSFANAGYASSIWLIGDQKEIILNSMDANLSNNVFYQEFNNIKYYAFILGFNHNANIEGTNLVHFCIGKNYENPSISQLVFFVHGKNFRGNDWSELGLRIKYCKDFLSVLPSDLISVIKSCNKQYTKNNNNNQIGIISDKIFLLSEYEIKGIKKIGYNKEGEQYEYFRQGGSLIFYDNEDIDNAVGWWTRTIGYNNNIGKGLVKILNTGTPFLGLYGDSLGDPAFLVLGFCV